MKDDGIRCDNLDCPIRKKCYRYVSRGTTGTSVRRLEFDKLRGGCGDHVPYPLPRSYPHEQVSV